MKDRRCRISQSAGQRGLQRDMGTRRKRPLWSRIGCRNVLTDVIHLLPGPSFVTQRRVRPVRP
eukprot:9469123-Pyramimonas_sp.AAC.1